jgi:tRNA A-37 threonylcarbamoyl transferase component Bud32
MIPLTGHSGCSVVLIGSNTVRKTSPGPEYDTRLRSQMMKQMEFRHDTLLTPRVTDFGINSNGRFFFDMEYIRGENLCEVFRKQPVSKCNEIIRTISSLHIGNFKMNIRNEIEEKMKTIPATQEDFDIVLSCDWLVDTGYCHGDLTFENVIVSDSGVYLIDFLDSFVSTPVIDHSKILQDAFCHWSFGDGYVPVRKLLDVCEMFDTKQNYGMLLVHLIRILPYANCKKKEILSCMMKKVRLKINQF